MSKKYDDYVNKLIEEGRIMYPFSHKYYQMFSEIDKDLDREFRDRAIINLVKMTTLEGKDLSYGDIRLIVDCDPKEKEYEESSQKVR